MSEFDNELYLDELNKTIEHIVGEAGLADATVMITGATGEIGGFLVDVLMQMNARIHVIACGRDLENMQRRFAHWNQDGAAKMLTFAHYDMLDEIGNDLDRLTMSNAGVADSKAGVDYIIHAAGNAYPSAFVNNPEETVQGNVIGTARLLDYAAKVGCKKFLYVSSGEVYSLGDDIKELIDGKLSELTTDGVNGIEPVAEDLCGFVMQKVRENGPRSCYPLSKAAAEMICTSEAVRQASGRLCDDAYAGGAKAAPVECVAARLCHTFGPGAKETDDRAHAQFARKAAGGETIVLNSAGTQLRSYNYIVDSASGILSVLLKGESGESYDICSPGNTVTIRELADLFAKAGGVEVVVNEPDDKQKALQSPINKQVLDSSKLESLGWTKAYELEDAIRNYVKILRG